MRILCITDKIYTESESSLKGIFEKYLLEYCKIDIMYFSKDSTKKSEGNKFILPYSTKHKRMLQNFMQVGGNFLDYDFIVVRNFYPVLKQILPYHKNIIFWETFPHDYRRIYEAKRDKKAIFRKSIEYKVKHFLHSKLLSKCVAYVGSTPLFYSIFYPNIPIKNSFIPNGIDFSTCNIKSIQKNTNTIHNPLKIIYIGSIDKNREMAFITHAISQVKGDFIFDIFTPSKNDEVEKISQITQKDSRIKLHPPLAFTEMLKTLSNYDIGLGIIPNTPLYEVSSPIKAMEYASNGVIPLINDLPEYLRLFDNTNAFFCEFTQNAIKDSIEKILSTSKDSLPDMKKSVFIMAQEKLDYKIITKDFYNFLISLK